MGSAKNIVLKPISSKRAAAFVKKTHYSGKVVRNSQIHIGVFYKGVLEGCMQFGPPMDKRRSAALVRGTMWQNFMELNRLAFSDVLPRNSESRALGIAFRLLAKHAPQVKWVLSFADATQCGDGTIYRASGFLLTGIKKNNQTFRMPDGSVMARKSLDHPAHITATGGYGSREALKNGAVPLEGYQFRYVKFVDPSWVGRLAVDVIPFSQIPPECRMYKGEKLSARPTGGGLPDQGGEGSSRLTRALLSEVL